MGLWMRTPPLWCVRRPIHARCTRLEVLGFFQFFPRMGRLKTHMVAPGKRRRASSEKQRTNDGHFPFQFRPKALLTGKGVSGERRSEFHEEKTSPTVKHGGGSIRVRAPVAARGSGNISLVEG